MRTLHIMNCHLPSIAIAVGMAVPCSVAAQQWCPPGAEWTHDYYTVNWSTGITHTGTMLARYAGDTVVGGHVAQRIEQDLYYEVLGTGEQHHGLLNSVHTRTADGVVWWWNIWEQEYDTLIWFSAVPGDRWTVSNQDPNLSYHVTDTATVLMQGVELRRLAVSLIYSGWEEPWLYVTDTLYERIGSSIYSTLWPPHPFLDDLIISFRCYQDEMISYTAPNDPDCAFDVGLDEPGGHGLPSVFPNPGSDRIRLQWNSRSADPIEVRIYNATGVHISTWSIREHLLEVDVSKLASGLYFIEFFNNRQRHAVTWLKQ